MAPIVFTVTPLTNEVLAVAAHEYRSPSFARRATAEKYAALFPAAAGATVVASRDLGVFDDGAGGLAAGGWRTTYHAAATIISYGTDARGRDWTVLRDEVLEGVAGYRIVNRPQRPQP